MGIPPPSSTDVCTPILVGRYHRCSGWVSSISFCPDMELVSIRAHHRVHEARNAQNKSLTSHWMRRMVDRQFPILPHDWCAAWGSEWLRTGIT